MDPGDVLELCLGKDGSVNTPLGRLRDCHLTFRARVVGSLVRMPGLYGMSGYRPAAYIGPDVIISQPQLKYLIDQYTEAYPAAKQKFEDVISQQPSNSSNGLPKKSVHIMLTEDADRVAANRLTNRLMQLAGEQNIYGFNVRNFKVEL